jgi:hypothetical protein
MSSGNHEQDIPPNGWIAAPAPPVPVAPDDRLCLPHRKRMSHFYQTGDTGARELCIYFGMQEITFDDERMFPFGEALTRNTVFTARDATAWGPGYTWPEIQPLLEALVGEGILRRGDEVDDPRGGGPVQSLLPPSTCPIARTWTPEDTEAITRDLGGRPVEFAHIESLLSVYRVPHAALDEDDRQVGEANVFPPGLRVDRETEWRVCQYSGSRYRETAPMNVTALKAMIKHWKPMMVTLLAVRAELLTRLRRVRDDSWTVGELHLLACVVLSAPSYLLMHGPDAAHRPLHPILSSLFRITDGIRMVTHEMMFLSAEPTRDPGERTSPAELYGFAERNGTFLSTHGVCAGPKPMIDELLTIAYEGTPVEGADAVQLPPAITDLLAQAPEAVDYALLGLQVWSLSRTLWLVMSVAYRGLRGVVNATSEPGLCARLRARFDDDWIVLNTQRIADDYERDVHTTVYRDTYEQSWRALRTPVGTARYDERIAPVPVSEHHRAVASQLRSLLAARLAGSALAAPAVVDRILEILLLELRAEQAVLAATTELQREINARLGRPDARRPLTALDLRVGFAMYGGALADFPYLYTSLERELGIRVECTADAIEVSATLPDREADPGRVDDPPAARA